MPELPHWETTPDDLPAAIREIKAALRARIEASGRSVREVFGVMEARVRARVEEIAADKARGATVWPVIDYGDIEAGTVTAEDRAAPAQRGAILSRHGACLDVAVVDDRPDRGTARLVGGDLLDAGPHPGLHDAEHLAHRPARRLDPGAQRGLDLADGGGEVIRGGLPVRQFRHRSSFGEDSLL